MPTRKVIPMERYRTPNLVDLAAAFIEARRRQLGPRKEKTTIRAYRQDLARFLAVHGDATADAITPVMIEGYLGSLRKPDGSALAPSSLNRYHASLSAFFEWLVDQDAIARNPAKPVRKCKVPEAPAGALSDDTIATLLAAAKSLGAREHALVSLALTTGARISELLALNIADVDLGGLTINIREAKGDKGRTAFFTSDDRKALKRLLVEHPEPRRPSAPLFTSTRGRLSYQRAVELFKEMSEGLTNPDGTPLRWHQCRHTTATRLLAAGMSHGHLMTIMGHADIRTLERYTRASRTAAAEQAFRDLHR